MSGNVDPAKKLGPRQERFVEEYLLDLNAKQAAIRAGYSPRTAEVQGSRLLSNAKVQRALSEAINRRAAKVEIDQEWVLSRLALVVERSLQNEPVKDREGNPVMIRTAQGQLAAAYAFQPGPATRALGLLGKHVGLFTDRLEVTEKTEERLLPNYTREDLITRLIEESPPALLAKVSQRLQDVQLLALTGRNGSR
jgi:phage terminase small subunit